MRHGNSFLCLKITPCPFFCHPRSEFHFFSWNWILVAQWASEMCFKWINCYFLHLFIVLQRLFLVSWWQHNCLLGAWRQRYPSKGDVDAAALQAGDQSTESVQRGGLQTALAEEWGLSVCKSRQDPQGYPGMPPPKHIHAMVGGCRTLAIQWSELRPWEGMTFCWYQSCFWYLL